MHFSSKQYIEIFNQTLNLHGISWWVIDYENEPDHFYCNELMEEVFNLDKTLHKHSIQDTCPIAGDYNKNIEIACGCEDQAKKIFDDYFKLINKEEDEYCNVFPYYNAKLDKTMYFLSRAKVLERTDNGDVTILYGIIEDITQIEEQKKELKYMNEKLEKLYIVDKLTGIYNRHKLDEVLEYEKNRAKRFGHPLGIMLIDIDHFKSINDTFGHNVGDKILQEFSSELEQNVREIDIVGRWGGEEFIIVCFEMDKDAMIKLAEKLKEKINANEFLQSKNCTASFGLTSYSKDDSVLKMIERADKALYKAKDDGRNRVEYKAKI